jgi:uncharacterized protein
VPKKRGSRYASSDLRAAARERPAKARPAGSRRGRTDSRIEGHRELMALLRDGKNPSGPDGVGPNISAGVVSQSAEAEFLQIMGMSAAPTESAERSGVLPSQDLRRFTEGAVQHYNARRDGLEADNERRRAEGKRVRHNSTIGSFWSGAYGLPSGQQTNLTSFEPMAANLQFAPLTLQWLTLMYAYTTYGIVQRAIDVPVYDAFRGGLELESNEIGYRDQEAVSEALEENGILESYRDSNIWARLFGGGAGIMNVEGEDYSKPFRMESLKQGKIEFYDASRWELGSESRIPVSGYYDFYGLKVHHSRVMTMCGKRAPFLIRDQLAGWGLSEIQRMSEDFNGYIRTKNAIFELMLEAKVDVFKVKNYRNQLNSPFSSQMTKRRIEEVNKFKSFSNAMVMDAEDDYQQKQIGFAGLAEIAKENRMNIAEAMQMPMSKIWGIGSSGFSSGEDDLETYNSMVESVVREPNRPRVRRVVKMVIRSLFGADLQFNFSYKPLRVQNSTEEETTRKSIHDRIMDNLARGLIGPRDALAWQRKARLIPIAIESAAEFSDLPGQPLGGEAEAVAELEDGNIAPGEELTVSTEGADRRRPDEKVANPMPVSDNGTPEGSPAGLAAIGREPPPIGFAGGTKGGEKPGYFPGGEEGRSSAVPWPGKVKQLEGANVVEEPGPGAPRNPERVEKAGE